MKTDLQPARPSKLPVTPVSYDRTAIKPGIVHIGVGNFHRAHEEFYTNKLLALGSNRDWGICGVALLPTDEKLYRSLKDQDGLYTLTVCGRDGKNEVCVIGSLIDLVWGIETPLAVIDKIAGEQTKIVTLTITEGGYNLDKETGNFILMDEAIQHDLQHPGQPLTVFGFLTAGLKERMEKGNGPLTILSCDNLQHNGDTARKALTAFITAGNPELAGWVAKNVTFPNSMVDRITPAVTAADIERLDADSGIDDAAPVYCEDFIQWVIEDKFAAGRPEWEKVGVEFTNDVTAYENMKLSLLNASHSLLSYPAFLAAYRKVDEAMEDEHLKQYLRDYMDKDATPYVPAPGSINLEDYKTTLLERFANKSVSDQISRLCFDGVSKIPVYVMPILAKMIRDGAALERLAFFVAAYRHYLKYKKDEMGNVYEVNEPWLTEQDRHLIESDDPMAFLGLSPFLSVNLAASIDFVNLYKAMVDAIRTDGIIPVLQRDILHN